MTDVKLNTLHMIGNAHLDPVWLWRWQDGFQEAKATFRSALDLMNESDDFLFTSSSAALYEWIEGNDPAMFAEIKQRVAEGRWEIVGGWWIQPDCNLPSGESLVRQGLYGQRFFQRALGVTATVGYNVDSFGHAGSLPQILRKSGMPRYVFMRPHPHEQHLPGRLFWWEAGDGSRVLAFRILYEYTTWGKGLEQHVERCASEFRENLDELLCFYGVGNHGGGPTRENLASIRAMQQDPTTPSLVFSTPSRYFASIEKETPDLPVFRDDLQHHASGCYSAHSGIKQWNRQAENLLISAEKVSALASLVVDQPYPEDFGHAWKGVLFNQFHDILAGTSIEPAYDDARDLYGEALAIAARNLNNGVQALSWRVGIPREDGSRPVVAFNPHAWPLRDIVELEFGRLRENDVLLDAAGNDVPFQSLRSDATVSSGSRTRLSFMAELPPTGYQTYRLMPGVPLTTRPMVQADNLSLENERFRVEISPDTGCLHSLFDKQESFEWLRGDSARALVLDDPSDTWSHGVLRFDRIIGAFRARTVRLVEHGPVKSVIRVTSEYGHSRLTQDFSLSPGRELLDVRVTVDWREQFKALKLNFAVNLDFTTATYEIPYGFLGRPANGEEEPGQGWVDLTGIGRAHGGRLGLSILNDAKYSYDIQQHDINLTVLRSPIYAHHAPYEPEADRDYSFIDQGIQRFRYALLPHAGSWEDAGTVRRTLEMNQPAVLLAESCHAGPLPLIASYLSVDSDHIVTSVLKRAEDGDGWVLRCYETAGRPGAATIQFDAADRTISATFTAGEIKTFLVPLDREVAVREVNLLEWESE